MEECTDNIRKRLRDDSRDNSGSCGINSPDPKRLRVDLENSTDDSGDSTLVRVDSNELPLESPEVQRIQDDLLHILDEDTVTERDPDPEIQGLESVIRSFEEEILVAAPELAPVVLDQTSDSGDSQLELGYLLEASDDELGLPPTISPKEETKIEAVDFETSSSGATGWTGLLGFESEIPNYDTFEFGVGFDPYNNTDDTSGEFVALGGLFDYTDRSFEPADNSEFLYLPE
ncbi:uncharacterized protein LOC122295514 [Carya illinoinensis]|uniref:Uncharacterized protein n=1 Tax=Carya illinoinensis TaxID=32201 RepID=A0A8T1N6Y2_CARIL|nr:uncharacterized protein LOC122295514 [Carya illinoinensis]KAG6627456.1 hypothetical protein CIPAW_15G129600 [Carya illinoinensis]